jgi:phosphate transport system permease protein
MFAVEGGFPFLFQSLFPILLRVVPALVVPLVIVGVIVLLARARLLEPVMHVVFLLAACVSVLCVALICLFLFANGLPAIGEIGPLRFLLGTSWRPGNGLYGIAPMILGSLYVTAGAIVVGVPLGLLTAVFMANFCGKRLHRLASPAISLLAGIPSVVYGFFGLVVLVPAVRILLGGSGKSMLTASVLLGVMILPTIAAVSEAALRAVPEIYYEGALALGATHERAVFFVVLPAAKSGVMAAVILGVGRSIGETMAVIMIAGNQPVIPGNPLLGLRTMTANIVIEMGYAADLHREALISTSVVLFVFILLINALFSLVKRRSL